MLKMTVVVVGGGGGGGGGGRHGSDWTGRCPSSFAAYIQGHYRACRSPISKSTSTLSKQAVAGGSAPAAAWRLCSDVAAALSAFLTGRTVDDGPDTGLLNTDLCFVPKLGMPEKPSNPAAVGGIPRADAKGSYLVWHATRQQLKETAPRSTTKLATSS